MANKITMGASSEVFPDLHHKMSKKIAQLTKVIYHLNTRNEDHQSELDALQSNQQYEIQTILKDASSRIQKFKEIIDVNKTHTSQEQLIEKMSKKHELEKLQALQDLSNLKSKMKEREKHISLEFQNKFDLLKDDISKMNNKFQERISSFESTNSDLKKSLDEAQKNGSSGIKEALERKEKEIADLIRINNEKYQEMLLEQLKIQEQLRNEHEKNIKTTKEDTEKAIRTEFEKQIGQIRAQLGAEKQEALLSLRRELEDKMNNQRDDLMSKIEKLLSDLKAKSDEYDRVNDEKRRLVDDLNKQLEEFKKRYSDQVGGKESVINDLNNELNALKAKNAELAGIVIKADEELSKIQRSLSEKTSAISQMEGTIDMLEKEVTHLKSELAKATQAGNSIEASLRSQVKKSEDELASLRNEINQMAAAAAVLREDAKKSEKKIQQIISDNEKVVSSMNNDKIALQRSIDDLKKQLKNLEDNVSNTNDKATNELALLRKQIEDRELQFKKQLLDADEIAKKTLEATKEKHKSDIEIYNNTKEMLMANAALKETELRNEITKIIDDNRSSTSSLIDSHNKVIDDLKAKHKDTIENMNVQIAELEAQIQSLSDQSAAKNGALQGEVQKWEGKTKALMKELEAKKKESERTESVCNGLKNQVESLREELKATQKAYREKMDLSVAKVEADWQAKLDAQIAQQEEEIAKVRNELELAHKIAIDAMIKLHEDEMNVLKNALQKEASTAADDQVKAENERIRLENLLRIEKEERCAEISELKSNHNTAIKVLEDAHKQALENLRNELTSSSSERERNMIQSHQNETNKLRAAAQLLEDELTQNMKIAVDNANANGEANLKAALAALEQKMNSEKERALSDLTNKHNQDIMSINDKHNSAINMLNDQLKGTIRSLENMKEESNQLNDQLGKERKERQLREERFVLDKDELMRQCENTVKRERENNERKLIEQHDESTSLIKQMKQGFNDEKSRYDAALAQAQKDYQELQTRYRNRESREEDLAKINELEQQMIAKDELVKQTREEMMYFKREMLNREESYNQKFNRTVNVGVMDPLSGKTKDASSKKGPGANKPTYAVPPTGGSMNGGLGLGIGNGVPSSSSSVPGRK